MKRAYMIHGWGGSSKEGWFPSVKKKLEGKGINVIAFEMPDTENPKIDEWIKFLRENIKDINKETVLIGHSIGCQAIMRFLEMLPESAKVKCCIFVAPWFDLTDETYEDEEDKEITKPWIETPIDFEKVKKHSDKFIAIFSDNDPFVNLSNADLFKERLEAKIITKSNRNHFLTFKHVNDIPELFNLF